jgi:hypothetical protein
MVPVMSMSQTQTHIYNLVKLYNPGTQRIDFMSPTLDKYFEILHDCPESSQFELEFDTDDVAIFKLNDRTLTYSRQNGSKHCIIDNVNRKIRYGNFFDLSGDIELFLALEPGWNKLYFTGAYNLKIRFKPMYL